MKEKIAILKGTMVAMDENYSEVVGELDKLGEEMTENRAFPGKKSVDDTIDDSIAALVDPQDSSGPDIYVSKRWSALKSDLAEWEQEHPTITLIVGNIARALAAAGL